jgi:hypothetical protein
MMPELFFTVVRAELQRRREPLDARELYDYAEGMWKLWDQDTAPGWADAYLAEQERAKGDTGSHLVAA